jgi:hypothetical protein
MPRIGDLLIVKPDPRRIHNSLGADVREYAGIVYEIERDKYRHPHKVHVQWSGDAPPSYNHEHGYAGTNIHNLRSKFQVIRGGVNII